MLTQYQRNALGEIIGALNDAPKGGETIQGRGFDVLSGPLCEVVMALASEDREEIEEATAELARIRPQLRAIGGQP